MSDGLQLTEAHRHALGSRLAGLAELLRRSQREGFDPPGLEPLLADIALIEEETGALSPRLPPDPVRGLLSRAVELAEDVAPRGLKQYGPLSDAAAEYLTSTSNRLERAVFELLDDLERREPVQISRAEGTL
ncbi:MAG TPA: hypothetical protein VH650_13745 [Gaiellaceae bacterium]